MTNKIIASIHAVAHSGGLRKEIYEIEMDLSSDEQRTGFLRVGSHGWPAEHYLLEMRAPGRTVSIPLPPSERLCTLADEALMCRIPAHFRAQAWVDDVATDIDDRLVSFNAVGALIRMDLQAAQALFANPLMLHQFDALADDLPARQSHSGPYVVDIDEVDVLRTVCLLSGMHGALGDNDSMQDVKPSMWDDFCIAARGILAAKEQARSSEVKLQIFGHEFVFSGQPGKACAIEATWSTAAEDDASRLSYSLMESSLLALYSAGVLHRDGRFDPKVVEAMETVLDAMGNAIERLDDESMGRGRSSPAEG